MSNWVSGWAVQAAPHPPPQTHIGLYAHLQCLWSAHLPATTAHLPWPQWLECYDWPTHPKGPPPQRGITGAWPPQPALHADAGDPNLSPVAYITNTWHPPKSIVNLLSEVQRCLICTQRMNHLLHDKALNAIFQPDSPLASSEITDLSIKSILLVSQRLFGVCTNWCGNIITTGYTAPFEVWPQGAVLGAPSTPTKCLYPLLKIANS